MIGCRLRRFAVWSTFTVTVRRSTRTSSPSRRCSRVSVRVRDTGRLPVTWPVVPVPSAARTRAAEADGAAGRPSTRPARATAAAAASGRRVRRLIGHLRRAGADPGR
ncbi:hypothetical protein GCM10025868_19500 [Angustibacter aerolatus]|uniref:Secreted protein n=1 Tax=Angustibacter aerolatus TaxID=1162965 RepID=A0ABQ6JEU6_9ACTN|nr:hypothetical protein GCM10025868_19500 [Angustibacter aerolatus]